MTKIIEALDLFFIIPDSRNDRTWNTDLKIKEDKCWCRVKGKNVLTEQSMLSE